MAATVAGLPKYVVLRSKYNNKYVHYHWNMEEFGQDSNPNGEILGCVRDIDPVSPLVKPEVVPSATVPSSFILLRCSYNKKFLKLQSHSGVLWLTPTAEAPEEDSTLFLGLFDGSQHPPAGPRQLDSDLTIYDPIQDCLCVYTHNSGDTTFSFEFEPWESYGEKMKAKDAEIVELRDKVAAWEAYEEERKAKLREEIQKLKDHVVEAWC